MSTQTYGRSVLRQTLDDIRRVNLWKERCLSFGPLAPGQTVYRKKAGDWRALPNPEARQMIVVASTGDGSLKPGTIIWMPPL